MKKFYIIIFIMFVFAAINLKAKTIWIVNGTNNHSSMTTYRNFLFEDLKLTHYKKFIKIVTNNKKVKEENKKGDIVIILQGMGIYTNSGNIITTYWIGCIVDNCKYWAYRHTASNYFSEDNIYKVSRETRNDIVKFLDKWF